MLTDEQRRYIEETFRIPVDSLSPTRAYWIISLDSDSSMSTDEELRQLQNYLKFVLQNIYDAPYQKIILERDLPKDVGHNTIVFRRGIQGEGDGWFYRYASWRVGSLFAPNFLEDDYRVHTLIEVMDRNETLFPERWEQWKKDHSEIFLPKQEEGDSDSTE